MKKITCAVVLLGLSLASTTALADFRVERSGIVVRIDSGYIRGFDDHRYRNHYRDSHRSRDYRHGYRQGYRDGLRQGYRAGHRLERTHRWHNHRAAPSRNARTFFGR